MVLIKKFNNIKFLNTLYWYNIVVLSLYRWNYLNYTIFDRKSENH